MTFHVPERYRRTTTSNTKWGEPTRHNAGNYGCFIVPPLRGQRKLYCLASDGEGWEHVSVHAHSTNKGRAIPNWDEMCSIKDLFWDPEDAVMQLHPRASVYVTTNAYVLHLWRPREETGMVIPEPDPTLVGFTKELAEQLGVKEHPQTEEEIEAAWKAMLNYSKAK
jgi:hypothetical protein